MVHLVHTPTWLDKSTRNQSYDAHTSHGREAKLVSYYGNFLLRSPNKESYALLRLGAIGWGHDCGTVVVVTNEDGIGNGLDNRRAIAQWHRAALILVLG
jgi:hypothetical protein